MPAKSKAQKTAMCMALAARKGDLEVSKLKGAALEIYNSDMTNKEIEEFTVMESLSKFINKNMKNLTEYILENSDTINMQPKSFDELKKTIEMLIKQRGNKADLNCINTSRITNMSELFRNSNFNGDISKWDVSNVEDMSAMFWKSKFNGDISKWDVSSVTDMTDVFAYSNFNRDISKWNTSNVIRMTGMFRGSKFNGDISKWDIRNVKFMNIMFTNSEFDGDISGWNIKNVKDTTMMFDGCPIKKEHKPGYIKLSELENNIKLNNKTAIKDFIINLVTNHGKKTTNGYTLDFGNLASRFWNSVPEGISYNKSKNQIYVKMYWQGDKTDGYEIITFDDVWGGDFRFRVRTGETMLSEKDTFIETLKELDKKFK